MKVNQIFNDFANRSIPNYLKTKAILENTSCYSLRDKIACSSEGLTTQEYRPAKEQLRQMVSKTLKYSEDIGAHPDFEDLAPEETEMHYAVSVFVDIKGSTKLSQKLPLEDVRFVKNGILTSVIDIFQAFDGHIHRLQGDAVFAIFGRKDMKKSDAIVDSLNAASFLQSFCKYQLNKIFVDNGLPELKIRVGIDFGDDSEVLWAHYGVKNCNEVTTTSLHTDLAAKLQSKAPSNGIMIGDNVRDFIDLPDEFYKKKTIVVNGETVERDYIFTHENKNYRMWLFDWERYLKRFVFWPEKLDTCTYTSGVHYNLKCYYKGAIDTSWTEYKSNCGTIPKNALLKFRLTDFIPNFTPDEIIWKVQNRGEEASEQPLEYDMTDYRDKRECDQATAYKGHHYMICTMKKQGRIVAREYFGLYVNDN